MSKDPHRFDPSPRKGEMTDTDKLIAKLEAENAQLRMDIVDNGSARILKQIVVNAEERGVKEFINTLHASGRCNLTDVELMQLWREGKK